MTWFDWFPTVVKMACLFSVAFVAGAWWHHVHVCQGCDRATEREEDSDVSTS